jgi:predicted RNA-binding Zn ribbon-like protein
MKQVILIHCGIGPMTTTTSDQTEHYATAPFEWVGGELCLDFVNTTAWERARSHGDRFVSLERVAQFGEEAGLISTDERRSVSDRSVEQSSQDLARALKVRRVLQSTFRAIASNGALSAKELEVFNDHLRRALSSFELVADESGYSLASASSDPVARILAAVVWSAARLLGDADELARLRLCGSDTCGWQFVDRSRNHSRRWCNMRDCGNRAKARRYYARHRGASA